MAVSFVAGSIVTTDITVASASWVVNAPTITDGDLVLIVTVTNATTTVTAPSGWTLVNGNGQNGGADDTVAVFYKIAASEPASWTLTSAFSSTQIGRAITLVYTGIDAVTPINTAASVSDTTGTTTSGPSITPTVDNCMIVQVIGTDPAGAFSVTEDVAKGATERFDGGDASFNAYVFVQDLLQAAKAAIALDATESVNANLGVFQFAIAPSGVYQPVVSLPSAARIGYTN